MIREHLYFKGNVQGVGFRHTTLQVAKQHDVAGFVRNLPDGRVELLAAGESIAVRDFVDAVQSAMAGRIVHLESTRSAATGEFGQPSAPHAFQVVV